MSLWWILLQYSTKLLLNIYENKIVIYEIRKGESKKKPQQLTDIQIKGKKQLRKNHHFKSSEINYADILMIYVFTPINLTIVLSIGIYQKTTILREN